MAQRALFCTNPLPLEGGEKLARRNPPRAAAGKAGADHTRFSPLEGEMAGRPEGVAEGFAEIASC